MPASDNQVTTPAAVSAQLTVFFDGRFWVGVLEHHERHQDGGAGTVQATRHVFGAEPSDVELHDFLLKHGGDLIDRVAASAPVPASRSAGSPTTGRRPNPKRAARQAAKDAARARPSTAAQAALAAAREETSARVARNRSRRRRQEAAEAWERRRQRAKRRHRGR
ncbi:YjdF family protein [Actinomyces sp. ZJ308]|uniref:YjdF family protein n=1 Tax=Actinomyces sp. ZJ308 TaxID=2708342 RepID=UPI0014206579|nr:YjdF family protein [Actinomyces sp. ZJ308]